MGRDLARERRGRLPLVAAHLCYRYDLSGINQGRGGAVYPLGAIIGEAVLHPGQRVSLYWEEGGYEYEWAAMLDPATCIVATNYTRCPNFACHHRGTTCAVCGQVG